MSFHGYDVAFIIFLLVATAVWLYPWPWQEPGRGISLMVPYQYDTERRAMTWQWLRRYWKEQLPGAEIVMGSNASTPWCKTAAVNDAFRKSKGDVVVVLDTDCYISGPVIQDCADQIREARKAGHSLWFVPYRHFYRLTNEASAKVITSDPKSSYRVPYPPPEGDVESREGSTQGHHYGALVTVLPREAFAMVGGMDERFSGWGGEDQAFMQAVDTIVGRHKTTPNQVFHLWHPKIGDTWKTRRWEGQALAGNNDALTNRYNHRFGKPDMMRELVSEPGSGIL